jgi:hypothetical protein
MKPPRIEVEIGELRLSGVPACHRYSIADAFQSELGLLLTELGIPADVAGLTDLQSSLQLQWTGATPAEQMGRSLAQSIYRSWSRPR